MRGNAAVLRTSKRSQVSKKQVVAEEQRQQWACSGNTNQFKSNRWRLRNPPCYCLIPAALVYPLVARKQRRVKFA